MEQQLVKKGKEPEKEWVLPNRFMFTKWIYQTFHPSKYASEKKSYFEPDNSQKLIRDYINYSSPYRGILVYHGLGTGKTCSAILASDSFVNHQQKVVVLLPASLENNYRKELKKCSKTGSLLKSKWSLVQLTIKDDMEWIEKIQKMTGIQRGFITEQKGTLWIPSYVTKDGSFPASKILQKEVSMKTMDTESKKLATLSYEHLINQRYNFLHYNGLTNKKLDELEKPNDYGEDAFDNAIVVIDEVHTFISRVVNGGKIARRLYNLLISKPNIRFVLLSGTPVINHPFELCYTLNLLRGPIKEYSIHSLKNTVLPDVEEVVNYLDEQKLYRHIDTLDVDASKTQISFTFLPKGFVRKTKQGTEIVKGPLYKDDPSMVERILSSLKKKYSVHGKYKTIEFTAFPDKREAFLEYFFDTTDPMKPIIKQENQEMFMRRIQGIVSYYRIADEEMFPKALEPLNKKVSMSNQQFNYYVERRNEEIKQEDLKKKKETQLRKRGGQADLFQTNSSYRAYSRMACNFVFPENIQRPFPKDVRMKILRREVDIQEDDLQDEEEEKEEKGKVNEAKMYEQEVKDALRRLNDEGDTYLQGKGLYECSPKMHTLLEDLQRNTFSKSLMYSQFRTVEGLRIFKMVLNHAGWKEIDFKQISEDDWMIINAEEVLDPKYDYKRYLVFGNKEKTDLLISLYNTDMKSLPKTIQKQLTDASYTENIRGKLASLLMITQSGAEGLNLRNVRYVYILEPFWNQVRIDQVIGRAIRKGSHLELPPEDRNVQVVMYIASFTTKQANSNKTIKFRDDSKTTDENIRELALRKDALIQQFLTMLKANSVDCIFHAPRNKPLLYNYKCYIPPVNVSPIQLSYVPGIEADKKNLSFGVRERVKKVKGKVVEVNGNKYVKLDTQKTLYDYDAYKDAAVLVEASMTLPETV